MKVTEFIKNTKPADVAKALGKKQVNSIRDKQLLLKKAVELEKFVNYFDKTINNEI